MEGKARERKKREEKDGKGEDRERGEERKRKWKGNERRGSVISQKPREPLKQAITAPFCRHFPNISGKNR